MIVSSINIRKYTKRNYTKEQFDELYKKHGKWIGVANELGIGSGNFTKIKRRVYENVSNK